MPDSDKMGARAPVSCRVWFDERSSMGFPIEEIMRARPRRGRNGRIDHQKYLSEYLGELLDIRFVESKGIGHRR
jgi:hypothetical protein